MEFPKLIVSPSFVGFRTLNVFFFWEMFFFLLPLKALQTVCFIACKSFKRIRSQAHKHVLSVKIEKEANI